MEVEGGIGLLVDESREDQPCWLAMARWLTSWWHPGDVWWHGADGLLSIEGNGGGLKAILMA